MEIERIFETSALHPTWRQHPETASTLALHRCEDLKFFKHYICFLCDAMTRTPRISKLWGPV